MRRLLTGMSRGVRRLVVMAVAGAAGLASSALGGDPAYLYLKLAGDEIKGEVTLPGRVDSIECFAFSMGGSVAYDPLSGIVGKRTYDLVTVRKQVDHTSPLLLRGMALGQAVEAEFDFYRVAQIGREERFYSVRLRNANILAYRMAVADTADPETSSYPQYEEIQIVFRSIEVFHEPSGTGFQDDGVSPAKAESTGLMAKGDTPAPAESGSATESTVPAPDTSAMPGKQE